MVPNPTKLAPQQGGSDAPLQARILDQDGLLALGNEWEELVENALEENAYFCRHYVEALLAHIETRPVQALTVWDSEHLIALLPFVTSRAHWGGIASLNKAWTTDYSMLSIPLIDARHAEQAARGLITALADGSAGGKVWLLPDVTLDGPVNSLLAAEMERHGVSHTALDVFERAILVNEGSFDDHMKTHVSKKRRKDLVRNRKRLSERGTLTLTVADQGADLDRAVEEFLRIEAAGWKGERGTALDCQDATRDFAKQAFGIHDDRSITRADVLKVDGQAIAVNLALQTGRTAFTIKCAFDETYRTYSAGLLLEEDMIRAFLEGDWADKLDSATAPGHLIQGLWNASTRIGDILLAGPSAPLGFKLYEALETLRRHARANAKSLVARFRD